MVASALLTKLKPYLKPESQYSNAWVPKQCIKITRNGVELESVSKEIEVIIFIFGDLVISCPIDENMGEGPSILVHEMRLLEYIC